MALVGGNMAQLPWAPGVCQVAASELEDPNALVDGMLSVRGSGRDGVKECTTSHRDVMWDSLRVNWAAPRP